MAAGVGQLDTNDQLDNYDNIHHDNDNGNDVLRVCVCVCVGYEMKRTSAQSKSLKTQATAQAGQKKGEKRQETTGW